MSVLSFPSYATDQSLSSYTTENSIIQELEDEDLQQLNNLKEIESEDLSDIIPIVLEESGVTIVLSFILFVIFIIFVKRSTKKTNTVDNLKKEISGYMTSVEKHNYSGNILVLSNGISYSRGNKIIVFDIPIEKDTFLAPFMIDDWFQDRNYNQREANIILSDISHYLKESGMCKNVNIISDEEYEEKFNTEE